MSQPLNSTDLNILSENYLSRTAVISEGSYRARALVDLPLIPPELENDLIPLYRHIHQYFQAHPNLASVPVAFSYRNITSTE